MIRKDEFLETLYKKELAKLAKRLAELNDLIYGSYDLQYLRHQNDLLKILAGCPIGTMSKVIEQHEAELGNLKKKAMKQKKLNTIKAIEKSIELERCIYFLQSELNFIEIRKGICS